MDDFFKNMVPVKGSYYAVFASGKCGICNAGGAEDARERFAILWPGEKIVELRQTNWRITPKWMPTLEALREGDRRNVTHYAQVHA